MKQLRVVKWHILKYSKDPQAQALHRWRLKRDEDGHIGTGRKTSPCLRLEKLEATASLRTIVGNAQTGRRGLGAGLTSKKWVAKGMSTVEQRHRLVSIMKEEAEHNRIVALQDYEMQASWLRWGLDKQMGKDFSWNKIIYQYSASLLKFIINARLNTVPSPDNLRRWKQKGSFRCALCLEENASLGHILGGCPWVRNNDSKSQSEDRYTWRHNCILLKLAKAIQAKLSEVNALPLRTISCPKIAFVPAGLPSAKAKRKEKGKDYEWLNSARDWQCDFDLPEFQPHGGRLVFPPDVCQTSSHIDGYIISRSTKTVIVGPELTAPLEEYVSHWNQVKWQKYENEIMAHIEPGWTAYHLPSVEVGALGFVPRTFGTALKKLGFSNTELAKLRDDCSRLSMKCSYAIWCHRFHKRFQTYRIE